MSSNPPRPLIAIAVSRQPPDENTSGQHTTGHRYVTAVTECADAVPFLLPALGDGQDFRDVVRLIDGLMLPGGRANIQPHHYGGPPFPDDEFIDPDRDATVLPLIRACIDHGIPIFGSCRGIQEINVALGGSLHYRIHELPNKQDHRMRRDLPRDRRHEPRHAISLAPDGLLAELTGATEDKVNSLHGQGIDRVGDGLQVEALAPDGVVEAIRLKDDRTFTVGVQWHAEFPRAENTLSRKLYQRFGEAARAHAAARARSARVT